MFWLLIAIFSQSIYAIVNLVDKYLLKGLLPNAKVYTFYIGILGILFVFLIPLSFLFPDFIKIDFIIPDSSQIALSLLAGGVSIFAILGFFSALKIFETSRVVPAVGGLIPVFTLTTFPFLLFLSLECFFL